MRALAISMLTVAMFIANFAQASSGVEGENVDLAWAIKAQNRDGKINYQLSFINFASTEPQIIAIDKLNLEAPNSRELIAMISQRYENCIDIKVDDDKKTIVVSPRELVFVQSRHVTNSTYTVNGKKPFSLVTEDTSKERYFCVHDPSLVKSEWQKRAFFEQ